MCSIRILFLLVTPHIHLSIFISFTSSRASCPVVVARVSAPFSIVGQTTVVYIFPFRFTGILLSHNTPLHLFQFLHAELTLCVISVAMHASCRSCSQLRDAVSNASTSPLQRCSGHSLAMCCAVWSVAPHSHDADGDSPIWFTLPLNLP